MAQTFQRRIQIGATDTGEYRRIKRFDAEPFSQQQTDFPLSGGNLDALPQAKVFRRVQDHFRPIEQIGRKFGMDQDIARLDLHVVQQNQPVFREGEFTGELH